LLGSLVSGFLLLRHVFGYLLPGALFLLGLIYTYSTTQSSVLHSVTSAFADTPKWLVIWFFVAGSYVIGHVLVAIGYQIYGGLRGLARIIRPETPEKTKAEVKTEAIERDAEILFHRYLYPGLFIDRDRRDTINILRIGLAIAFLALAAILQLGWAPRIVLLAWTTWQISVLLR
jgi:hypothetical protein